MHDNAHRMTIRLFSLVIPLCVLSDHALGQHSVPPGNPLDVLPRTTPAQPGGARASIEAPAPQPQDVMAQVIVPRQFDIVGVRSLPFEDIAKVFVPLAGQSVTVAGIVEVASQVTAKYKEAGYALSFAFIPPQDFRDGVVRVVVVEGYVAHLEIEGNPGRSEALLREIAAPLLNERPLRTATFERQTQLMARLPGVRTLASAQLPTTTDGATTLRLVTKHQPYAFSLGGEIRQPVSRAIAALTLNDPFVGGSQLQMSTLLRPFNKERFLSAAYGQTLNTEGTLARLSLSDYRGVGQPNPALAGVDDVTRQRRFDASVQHPWRLTGRESGMVGGGFYVVDYSRTYTAMATGNQQRETQQIRALFGQLAWSRTEVDAARSASLMLVHGIDAAGAKAERSNNYGAALAPDPARLNFVRVAFDASERRRITSSGWGAAVAVGGQISPHILPAPERISFGGSRFGRGYQAGEVASDSGLGGSVEINHSFPASTQWLKQWEPYVLLEAARTWQRQPGVPDSHLRSASVGVRFNDSRHYSADIAVSKPLGDPATENPNRRMRVSLLLSYQLDPL